MRKGDKPLRIDSIRFYLHGDETDVVVPGPTELAEVMLWGGKFTVRGTPGTKVPESIRRTPSAAKVFCVFLTSASSCGTDRSLLR